MRKRENPKKFCVVYNRPQGGNFANGSGQYLDCLACHWGKVPSIFNLRVKPKLCIPALDIFALVWSELLCWQKTVFFSYSKFEFVNLWFLSILHALESTRDWQFFELKFLMIHHLIILSFGYRLLANTILYIKLYNLQ